MATGRSFAEYVKSKCYNGLYSEAESFVCNRSDELNLWSHKVHNIGSIDFIDATIRRVYIQDLPDMRVAFDVAMELDLKIHERAYHYTL